MSSVVPVPETSRIPGDELAADDALATLRSYGLWTLTRESFVRFRYGDGFTHSRALGLQLCLAVIPLVIALVGLSRDLNTEVVGVVLERTILALTPGSSDELFRATLSPEPTGDDDGAEVALWLGLSFAVVAMTTAMGQIERGANRIYGIQRDRPTDSKYRRAAVMAVGAGLPALFGLVVLVSTRAVAGVIEELYGVDDDLVYAPAFPLAGLLLLGAVTVMLRYSPRRRQPGWSWLVAGGAVVLVLWVVFTVLLAGYLQLAGSVGSVYGPLTGIIALLIWAQLIAAAIFLGLAVCAQLEAARAGRLRAAAADPLA